MSKLKVNVFRYDFLVVAYFFFLSPLTLRCAGDAKLIGPSVGVIVMEFVSLGSLLGWIEKYPEMSVLIGEANISKILGIIYSLLECTVFLHDMDIVHRDIKPANILLSTTSQVMLADLGESIPIASSPAISTATMKAMTMKETKGKCYQ